MSGSRFVSEKVEIIRRHPDRYAGLATIPVQDVKRSVQELERAITKLKLNGVMINSHTRAASG